MVQLDIFNLYGPKCSVCKKNIKKKQPHLIQLYKNILEPFLLYWRFILFYVLDLTDDISYDNPNYVVKITLRFGV